ncbi:GntR family transcriptional regulator [Bacterioplanes sanyensis]|uniref:GntR family transcriptional regulator n=1 Tax=Bacterioplanes sanyensis TaxID=1249553 RepID=UPI001675509F|nr:GntR family transcriptional regulator [Bacterioplanes sanyensis]GGY41911.1 GntR family transcriptional regulator [Bacterioplanes sanyensis]
MTEWNDKEPIYRQIEARIIGLILDGSLPEGEAIPSVRALASDYQINHLTVSKAYQELVARELLEKRRGLGMFVATGARQALQEEQARQFIEQELPAFLARIKQLGIDHDTIIDAIRTSQEPDV